MRKIDLRFLNDIPDVDVADLLRYSIKVDFDVSKHKQLIFFMIYLWSASASINISKPKLTNDWLFIYFTSKPSIYCWYSKSSFFVHYLALCAFQLEHQHRSNQNESCLLINHSPISLFYTNAIPIGIFNYFVYLIGVQTRRGVDMGTPHSNEFILETVEDCIQSRLFLLWDRT